jgi:hypothetical protein
MPKATKWSWCYEDHLSFKSGLGSTKGYVGAASSRKHKIYCKKCLDNHILTLIQQDKDNVTLGHRVILRDQQQIESYCMS